MSQLSSVVLNDETFRDYFVLPENELIEIATRYNYDISRLTLLDFLMIETNTEESLTLFKQRATREKLIYFSQIEPFNYLNEDMLYEIIVRTEPKDLKNLYLSSRKVRNMLNEPKILSKIYEIYYDEYSIDYELFLLEDSIRFGEKEPKNYPNNLDELLKEITHLDKKFNKYDKVILMIIKDEFKKYNDFDFSTFEDKPIIDYVIARGKVKYIPKLLSQSPHNVMRTMILDKREYLIPQIIEETDGYCSDLIFAIVGQSRSKQCGLFQYVDEYEGNIYIPIYNGYVIMKAIIEPLKTCRDTFMSIAQKISVYDDEKEKPGKDDIISIIEFFFYTEQIDKAREISEIYGFEEEFSRLQT